MSVAPCEHSLSILHAQHHRVWRRPPRPVLGSFHLLLPLVEISFVSVPAARGLDHLELCKHPRPAPPLVQASLTPAEAQSDSRTAQPLSARYRVPSNLSGTPSTEGDPPQHVSSPEPRDPVLGYNPCAHRGLIRLKPAASWLPVALSEAPFICNPIPSPCAFLQAYTVPRPPHAPPTSELSSHPPRDYVDIDPRIHIHSHLSLASDLWNCQRPEPGFGVGGQSDPYALPRQCPWSA